MTHVIMIPNDSSIIYTQSSLPSETLEQTINSGDWQSHLEDWGSLTLTLDPANMKASSMGDLVMIYARERESPSSRARNIADVYDLTFRQQHILADLCEGRSQKKIALHLDISLCTVGAEVAALKKVIPSLSILCSGVRVQMQVPPEI